jgi:NAD(P)-dependent dehydrogenase (short-subunit alcohol dehydrogenase family)
VGDPHFCREAVEQTVRQFFQLDILVNNAAYQHHQQDLEDITDEQLERTFRTNIFGYFYMARAALKHLKQGGVIINTGSITGLEGSPQVMDHADAATGPTGRDRACVRVLRIAGGLILHHRRSADAARWGNHGRVRRWQAWRCHGMCVVVATRGTFSSPLGTLLIRPEGLAGRAY